MLANHPAGFSRANVGADGGQQGRAAGAGGDGADLVVITAGIDLSVGMVFMLTNCLASWIVVGTACAAALGVVGVLAAGALCGAINGVIVIFGRLQPIVTTIATGAVYSPASRCRCGRSPAATSTTPLADALTGKLFGVLPASLVALAAVVLVVWVPFTRARRSAGRPMPSALPRPAAYMSGVPIARAKFLAYVAGRPAGRRSAACSSPSSPIPARPARDRRHLHALFHRRRRARRRLAVRRPRQRDRRDLRRAAVPHHRRPAVRVQPRSAVAAAVPGPGAAGRRRRSARRGCFRCATGWSCSRERPRRPRAKLGLRLSASIRRC